MPGKRFFSARLSPVSADVNKRMAWLGPGLNPNASNNPLARVGAYCAGEVKLRLDLESAAERERERERAS